MADIDIVPKHRSSTWIWIVLAIIVVALVIWATMGRGNGQGSGSLLLEDGLRAATPALAFNAPEATYA